MSSIDGSKRRFHEGTSALVEYPGYRWPHRHASRSHRPARGLAHHTSRQRHGRARRAARQEPIPPTSLLRSCSDCDRCWIDVRAEYVRRCWWQHGAFDVVGACHSALPCRLDLGSRRRHSEADRVLQRPHTMKKTKTIIGNLRTGASRQTRFARCSCARR